MEKEMTGLYLSGHPMDKYGKWIAETGCASTFEMLEAAKGTGAYRDGAPVSLCGIITHITVKQTRANKANMAFVTLEDLYGTVEAVLFPKVFVQYSAIINNGAVIAVRGTLSVEEEKDAKILVNAVFKPDAAGAAALKQGGERRQAPAKKSKHPGLYLKFRSETDERRQRRA